MPCEVRFRLFSNAPDEQVDVWKTVVKALTDSHHKDRVRKELHEAISRKVQATATLHKNDAKILKRCEGGFGGDMNECDRQICFKSRSGVYVYDPLEIHMVPYSGDVKPLPGDPYDKDPGNHKMEWTMPDLIDFKNATVMALHSYMYEKLTKAEIGKRAHQWVSFEMLAFDAHIVFFDYDEHIRGPTDQKDAFEFFVNNYPNKKRKKRVIGTKTAYERQKDIIAEIEAVEARMEKANA
jgi:hypothetical protein